MTISEMMKRDRCSYTQAKAKAEREPPVRSSELVRDHEPRYSKMELIRAVNACCTCGGGGPAVKHTCPACMVYHRLVTLRANEKGQQ